MSPSPNVAHFITLEKLNGKVILEQRNTVHLYKLNGKKNP